MFYLHVINDGGDRLIMSSTASTTEGQTLCIFRKPTLEDGSAVWKLVKSTGVLDLNSSYSYLMWCQNFGQTSVVVEQDDEIVGFVSGFIKPEKPDRLFIWQVAVDESQRGKGLASKMLQHILERDSCQNVHFVEATVTPSNIASQKLFRRLARNLDTHIHVSKCFGADDFPEEGHEDELTHEIGPF